MHKVLNRKHVAVFLCGIGLLPLLTLFNQIYSDVPPLYRKSDALVLLAGSYAGKIDITASLFKNGVAGKIILTNDGVKSRWSSEHQRNLYNIEWTEEGLVTKGVPRSAIVKLDFEKSGTIHDAVAVRDYVLSHSVKSIVLVTFDYHSKRAYWSFNRVLRGIPTEIQVYAIKTQPRGVTNRLLEVFKYDYYLLRYGFSCAKFCYPNKIDRC